MNGVLIELICGYMPIRDIVRLSQTCKMAFERVRSDRMWIQLLKDRYNVSYYKKTELKVNLTGFMTFIYYAINQAKQLIQNKIRCLQLENDDLVREFWNFDFDDQDRFYTFYFGRCDDISNRIRMYYDTLDQLNSNFKHVISNIVNKQKQLEKNRLRNQKRRCSAKRNKNRNWARKQNKDVKISESKFDEVKEFTPHSNHLGTTLGLFELIDELS